MTTDYTQLEDQIRRWTLADLVADSYAVSRVPSQRLEQLIPELAFVVSAPQMDPAARERLQELKTSMARVLGIRRQMDAQAAKQKAELVSAQPEEAAAQPEQTDADRALRLLRAVLSIAGQDDPPPPQGGSRISRPVPPTRPTPPAAAPRVPVPVPVHRQPVPDPVAF